MSVSHVSSAFKTMRGMHQLTHHPRAGCQLESKINVVEASLPPSFRDSLRYSRLVSSSCIGNTSLCIFIIPSSLLPRYNFKTFLQIDNPETGFPRTKFFQCPFARSSPTASSHRFKHSHSHCRPHHSHLQLEPKAQSHGSAAARSGLRSRRNLWGSCRPIVGR